MNRALLSLPKHEHIQFLSQVAILEFKNGVPDKGRSIFEKMLREYPKRRDLWSVYLDQVMIVSSSSISILDFSSMLFWEVRITDFCIVNCAGNSIG